MKTVETKNAPAAIGPYSQAIVSGNLLFTSGQIPLDPATGKTVGETVEEQTTQALKNLAALCEAAGSSLARIVKTTCYLTDMKDFAAFNAVYESFFPGKPARSCVAVAALPKGVLVEVEAVAEL